MTDGPLCVFCGSDFPVELERCPTCGRPWIDQRLSEVQEGAVVPLGEVAAPLTSIDPEPGRRVPLWLIAGGVALAALTLYGVVFSLLLDEGDAAAAGTTTPQSTAPQSTTAAPGPTTSAPPTTTGPSPSTTSSTTTTSTTTTTTTTTTTIPPIPEGTPIPIEDVTLGAFALGPIQVGSDGTTAIERLAATFGQPTLFTPLDGGDAGICPDEEGRALRFGWVTALLVSGEDNAETFVGYRYDEGPPGHSSEGLETISGAGLGDTVADLDAIYSGSVEVGDLDGVPHFFLLRSSDSRTLLWGQVDAPNENGIVEAINAPYWCDDGPSAP